MAYAAGVDEIIHPLPVLIGVSGAVASHTDLLCNSLPGQRREVGMLLEAILRYRTYLCTHTPLIKASRAWWVNRCAAFFLWPLAFLWLEDISTCALKTGRQETVRCAFKYCTQSFHPARQTNQLPTYHVIRPDTGLRASMQCKFQPFRLVEWVLPKPPATSLSFSLSLPVTCLLFKTASHFPRSTFS